MYTSNIINDYENFTGPKTPKDYDITTLSNCRNNENHIDIITPILLLTIPRGLSFLCLMSLMVYTLITPLFDNK